MKIEVGKSYPTRGGDMAKIMEYIPGRKYPYIGVVSGMDFSWADDGSHCLGEHCDIDLIISIDDAALCAADVSSAFNAQARKMGTPVVGDLIKTRSETHGSFDTNSHVSQCIKAILRDERGWERLKTTQQEALDHICGKIGRIMAGDPDHADHWIDIAGYAQLAARGDE